MIEDIKFVHPKDMQDGTILISDTDITTNLPYVEGVHLAFDHHASELVRLGEKPDNYITNPDAPSAARVVYDHYGGKEKFQKISEDMMEAVDKGDSAQFSEDEILNAEGWVLFNSISIRIRLRVLFPAPMGREVPEPARLRQRTRPRRPLGEAPPREREWRTPRWKSPGRPEPKPQPP